DPVRCSMCLILLLETFKLNINFSLMCSPKALFPAATRHCIAVTSPFSFYTHQILVAGIIFESDGSFLIADDQPSSLQKTSLDFICREIIPKTLADVSRHIFNLCGQADALHQEDFERTLLTLVVTAQKVLTSSTDTKRDARKKDQTSQMNFKGRV
uniref:Uncharacterized protein n=1 Tax=Nothobranchius furzeri TaxID=105023 RepID=A0A8C6L1L1_NOTFU